MMIIKLISVLLLLNMFLIFSLKSYVTFLINILKLLGIMDYTLLRIIVIIMKKTYQVTPLEERRMNGMKRSLVNQNHLKKQTGNTLEDIVKQRIDNETRMVIEYFEAHNISYG